MPALKVPHRSTSPQAREAVRRTQEEMKILDLLKMAHPEHSCDYFLGLLWIEGFKVVSLTEAERKLPWR